MACIKTGKMNVNKQQNMQQRCDANFWQWNEWMKGRRGRCTNWGGDWVQREKLQRGSGGQGEKGEVAGTGSKSQSAKNSVQTFYGTFGLFCSAAVAAAASVAASSCKLLRGSMHTHTQTQTHTHTCTCIRTHTHGKSNNCWQSLATWVGQKDFYVVVVCCCIYPVINEKLSKKGIAKRLKGQSIKHKYCWAVAANSHNWIFLCYSSFSVCQWIGYRWI